METRLQKWGNSQGVRLPRTVLDEAHLKSGDRVQITVQNGAIVIRPVTHPPSLQALLEGIRPDNLHDEIASGGPEGGESW